MKKTLKHIIQHPLFSGSIVMLIGSNTVNFLNYLYHLTMGRILGPAGYGELATLISIIGLLGIVPSSLNLVVIKHISASKNDQEIEDLITYLRGKTLRVTVVLFSIILLISPFISNFLHINNNMYFFLIAVSFLFIIPSILNKAILQGLLKFKETVLSTLAETAGKLILGVLFVFLGFKVSGALGGFVISIAIGWLVSGLFVKYKKSYAKSINLKPLILYAIPVIIYSFTTTLLYSTDIILVKHFFSSHDAGLYAALSTLARIIFFGTGPIGAVMFPLISKKSATGSDYKRVFLYSFFMTLFFSLSMLLIYFLYPSLMISLLYGPLYTEASALLVWFGIFVTIYTLSSLLINFNLSLDRTIIVILPFFAALTQAIGIWIFHNSLFTVILVSIAVNSGLLLSLVSYSMYKERVVIWR